MVLVMFVVVVFVVEMLCVVMVWVVVFVFGVGCGGGVLVVMAVMVVVMLHDDVGLVLVVCVSLFDVYGVAAGFVFQGCNACYECIFFLCYLEAQIVACSMGS